MESRVLNKKGSSMLDALAVIIMIVVVLSAIISSGIQRIQSAEYQKTVTEMQSIAQASLDYYQARGNCPSATAQLAPSYMAQAIALSPFNSIYQISCGESWVSVSNAITTGIAKNSPGGPLMQILSSGGTDTITITMTMPYQFAGRVLYEKGSL